MLMSWIFMAMTAISLAFSVFLGRGAELSGAVAAGAKAGIELAIALAGSICLWTGFGKLMEKNGLSEALARLLRPLLIRIFPEADGDGVLAGSLSANITANLLGLGNAATPMGIQSARRLAGNSTVAGDSLCRLIVLNTASIQLIPANVAALRSSLGSAKPFAILPAVWLASLCSASAGLALAWVLGKLWKHV